MIDVPGHALAAISAGRSAVHAPSVALDGESGSYRDRKWWLRALECLMPREQRRPSIIGEGARIARGGIPTRIKIMFER